MVRRGRPRPLRRCRNQGDQGGDPRRALCRRAGRRGPAGPRCATISDDYARHCLSFVDASRIPKLKVVLDTGNGMGAVGASAIFARLPVDEPAASTSSWTAPSRTTRPTPSRKRIAARSWSAWLAEKRRPRHRLGWRRRPLLLHRRLGARSSRATSSRRSSARPSAARSRAPGSSMTSGRPAPCAIACRRPAGEALMHRVGHAFIKKRMRDENAAFGGEVSGHFYFRENWYADNGMIPALLVLELLGGTAPAALRAPAPACASATTSRGRSTPGSATWLPRSGGSRSATRTADFPNWTASPSTTTTGTSTCVPPTPSRCCDSTSRPTRREAMERRRDEVLAIIRA